MVNLHLRLMASLRKGDSHYLWSGLPFGVSCLLYLFPIPWHSELEAQLSLVPGVPQTCLQVDIQRVVPTLPLDSFLTIQDVGIVREYVADGLGSS